MDNLISKNNQKLADHFAKLCNNTFHDAKRLTLSAWSWPSWHVAAEAGQAFSFNSPNSCIISDNLNLNYVNPPAHLEIMSSIVESDKDEFSAKIKDCLALSLRVDGSVDRTQIDKI